VSVCPTSADLDRSSPLILGNVATDRLAALLARFQATPLFGVISRWGPLGLHVLANGTTDTGMLGLGDRLHDCHLCRSLTADGTVVRRVSERQGIDLLEPAAPAVLERVLVRVATSIAAVASGRPAASTPAAPPAPIPG